MKAVKFYDKHCVKEGFGKFPVSSKKNEKKNEEIL